MCKSVVYNANNILITTENSVIDLALMDLNLRKTFLCLAHVFKNSSKCFFFL